MFARTVIRRRGLRDEGEKPFWISFADLMTASMTVFLIVMAVTIVAMREELNNIATATRQAQVRQAEIERFANRLKGSSEEMRPPVNVSIIKDTVRIDLGSAVNFGSGSADITSSGSKFLRRYLPKVLEAAQTELGKKWLKRVVVEGFTDTDGTYLFNLDLSLQRSRKVVCTMFAPATEGERAMTQAELKQIRDLFLVGGYSFNSIQASKAKSRRVELKLEFWQLGEKEQAEKQPKPDLSEKEFGRC
jgi:outer membrane protein OmpA-like peptidoglycan-associated protein